jgi:competence protein ComEC
VVSRRDPLVLPLAALICGIVAARYLRFTKSELIAAIAALVLVWMVARWKAKRLSVVPGFVAVALIGCAVSAFRGPAPQPELTEEDNQVMIVAGCVVEPPSAIAPILRFGVELEPGARIRVTLTPRDGELLPALRYGDRVEIEARVRKPVNFGNPGAFDFAGYLARQQIYWTASARGVDKLQVINKTGEGRCGSRWRQAWFDAREWALHRVEELFHGDPYTVAMMSGMLLGDAAAIERSWTEDFRRTGTYHTLVISGLHITVLAGVLLTALRLCFIPVSARVVISGLAAWAYAFTTGMQTPVARSAAGFTLFLIAGFFFRKGRVLNLLAAVAIVFLIIDPDQAADASFQLSFLAVAAIGALAIPLIESTSGIVRSALRALSDTGRDAALDPAVAALRVELRLLIETLSFLTRAPSWLVSRGVIGTSQAAVYVYELILVSFCVQLALILPSVAYFHRISLTSLTANAFAVPVLSAAVPFGFVSILTGWTLPAWIAAKLLLASRFAVEWHAQFEPPLRIPDLPLAIQLCVGAILIITAILTYRAARWRAVVLIAAALIIGIICFSPEPASRTARLEMTSIDVGQGDSHLIVTPEGRTLLIDAGGIPVFDPKYKPRLEIGEDVVSPYLWHRGMRHLDAVALTHAHDDHARGLIAVIENFRPGELWTGSQPASGVWLELVQKARAYGVKVIARRAGEQWDWGGASMRVLAPFENQDHAPSSPKAIAHNNDSLVLQVSYGKHRFLLTGDAERQVEEGLVNSGSLSRIDVLKVGHHGSRTSTTPGLLEAVQPPFAIISAGRNNSYRHPHPDVMSRLQAAHAQILRTDGNGAITVVSDGSRILVDTYGWQGTRPGVRHPLSGEY